MDGAVLPHAHVRDGDWHAASSDTNPSALGLISTIEQCGAPTARSLQSPCFRASGGTNPRVFVLVAVPADSVARTRTSCSPRARLRTKAAVTPRRWRRWATRTRRAAGGGSTSSRGVFSHHSAGSALRKARPCRDASTRASSRAPALQTNVLRLWARFSSVPHSGHALRSLLLLFFAF